MGFFADLHGFDEANIVFSLSTDTYEGIFKELVASLELKDSLSQQQAKAVLHGLLEREKCGSTAIGKGIMVPHIKTEIVETAMVAIGIHRKGLDCHAPDKQLSHIFILSVFPLQETTLGLKFLASVSRALYKALLQEQILLAGSSKEIWDIFIEKV